MVFKRKSIFCEWGLLILFGLINPAFGGVMLLKLFDLSYTFEDIEFKIAIVWQN